MAALANAQHLLGDAKALLAHGSPPTALAIATLAVEEGIKALHLAVQVAEADGPTVSPLASNHASRLLAARSMEGVIGAFLSVVSTLFRDPHRLKEASRGPTAAELDAQQQSDNRRKQRGFYVDVDADGLHLPGDIDLAEATAVTDRAGVIVTIAETILTHVPVVD